MANIASFKGILYSSQDINNLVAPPYDVVTESERDNLVSKSPYNIFQLELPKCNHSQPCNDRYEHAKNLFRNWLDNGILAQDEEAAIYPYEISFTINGKKHIREGFIARLGIEPWENRVVRPHEQTFDKVTEDRMKLLAATNAQFSQIFAIYRSNERIKDALHLLMKHRQPLFSVTDALGNHHTLYRLTDYHALNALIAAFKDMPVYIADGHHRYTTALRYWEQLKKQDKAKDDAGFIATYFVNADDPGLIVLPTHRVLNLPSGFDHTELLMAFKRDMATNFEISSISLSPGATEMELEHLLQKHLFSATGLPVFGIVTADKTTLELWRLKQDSSAYTGLKRLPAPLAELDVVAFNEIILAWFKGHLSNMDIKQAISYSAEGGKAIRTLANNQMLFCMRPTSVQDVLNVADAGLTMPHKATFFYPKILTGMVINPLNTI